MQKLKSTSSSMLCSSWLFHTNDRKNCVHFDLNEQSKRNIYFKYSYATNEHNERKSEKNSVLSPLRPLSPPFYYSSNKQLLMSIFVLNSCAENGHGHPFFHSFRTMISIAHNVGKKMFNLHIGRGIILKKPEHEWPIQRWMWVCECLVLYQAMV